MEYNMYFDQCMDFLARMIEKYGDKVDLQAAAEEDEDNERRNRRPAA